MAKKTIMVVDDEGVIVDVVEKILQSKGYNVITALSGRECLEALKTKPVDLILLDIMMPEMDGWDVCENIKSNKKTEKIPIIFLTAKADPISRSMGVLASQDYISKPFDVKDLLSRVNKVINLKVQ